MLITSIPPGTDEEMLSIILNLLSTYGAVNSSDVQQFFALPGKKFNELTRVLRARKVLMDDGLMYIKLFDKHVVDSKYLNAFSIVSMLRTQSTLTAAEFSFMKGNSPFLLKAYRTWKDETRQSKLKTYSIIDLSNSTIRFQILKDMLENCSQDEFTTILIYVPTLDDLSFINCKQTVFFVIREPDEHGRQVLNFYDKKEWR